MQHSELASASSGLEIAIVGMAGRFPGAASLDVFWHNLCAGVESITTFSEHELRAAGVGEELLRNPNYVRASAVLDGIELFDAAFFGMTPREATITDPQQRLFLECAWEALEHAGYDAQRYRGAIGVYAGVGMPTYVGLLQHDQSFLGGADDYLVMIGNQKDFLSTRVAYKLGLRGPALTVQTACSTSLVAVHLACQGLLSGESDMALAGGASLRVPHQVGYLYQPGGVTSPDGHCRAFDAQAQGTVIGGGVGVVVLKRLDDALSDGDSIYAVIKGSAINNDGAHKVGYMAPSVEGQAQVITAAQRIAEVAPETIGYIEAHGTGTALGDPIEVAALTRAFRAGTSRTAFCAIGSLKSNIGHLDVAAGVAGLIKATLALRHRQLPPSLHVARPNPSIDFASSPFYVNSGLAAWPARGTPRRAGVSAFGIGGTNAHVVLEEHPPLLEPSAAPPWQLVVLSARSPAALAQATANLAAHLRRHPDCSLADVAYTLQVGRRAFGQRHAIVCRNHNDALAALDAFDAEHTGTGTYSGEHPVAFLFPGGGAQYLAMGRDLYETEPVFREQFDRCALLLRPHLPHDLRAVLYPPEAQAEEAATRLRSTALGLPALFTVEYALAMLWASWGLRPQAMLGHSLGEYVAACLAGVMTLDDALAMVALRGRLFEQVPRGAMLSVALPEHELLPLLNAQLSIAAINSPTQCVVSGAMAAVESLAETLAARGARCRLLQIDVAAHSSLLEPILEAFYDFVATVRLRAPTIPYVSNVSGTWITAEQATDPHYWVRHLRQTVRFSDGVRTLAENQHLFLEVGPGHTLSTLLKQHAGLAARIALPSLPHPDDPQTGRAALLATLGKLWLAGATVDWASLHSQPRRRVPLPTYPFQRQRYWPGAAVSAHRASADGVVSRGAPEPQGGAPAAGDPDMAIAVLWQQTLGLVDIGPHENFFELGGDSLLAVQLIARLRDQLGVQLSPGSLLQAPTIAGLAALCRERRAEAGVLVPLQAGGKRPPLFLVHPIGGGVYGYRELARLLGAEQPVYGLQAQGFADDGPPLRQVEAIADRYRTAIEAVWPAGPYLLGGASFGGVVALELAQQLQARGKEVALTALIDSAAPRALPPALAAPDRHDAVQFQRWLERVQAPANSSGALEPKELQRLAALASTHLQALHDYRPLPYERPIVFFRAAERDLFNPAHPEHGWQEIAVGGMAVHEVPGDHTSMLATPHVQRLAELLSGYLPDL